MGETTKIEWTDSTWNPIRARNLATGKIGWHCEHVSEGCRNCYADGMNRRLGTGLDFKPGHRKDIEIFLDENMLLAPLKWKKPRRIFVCSMTDLFADFVRDEWIDRMFAVMALAPQHRFQVLTKRAKRMREWVSRAVSLAQAAKYGGTVIADELPHVTTSIAHPQGMRDWPLPNVWLGVSAEDQANADARIHDLLATPAAVRFVSLEPLLGPIDLTRIEAAATGSLKAGDFSYPKRINALTGEAGHYPGKGIFHPNSHSLPHLDWVIVGGESGPHARPMHPQWARDIRDQCKAAGVAFFFKQHGEWLSCTDDNGEISYGGDKVHYWPGMDGDGACYLVGKRAAGRLLDGIEHNGMPR